MDAMEQGRHMETAALASVVQAAGPTATIIMVDVAAPAVGHTVHIRRRRPHRRRPRPRRRRPRPQDHQYQQGPHSCFLVRLRPTSFRHLFPWFASMLMAPLEEQDTTPANGAQEDLVAVSQR